MTQGRRNLLSGLIAAIFYVIWSIVIPLEIFKFLATPEAAQYGIQLTQQELNEFKYWIVAFGLISTAAVFVRSSSPKYSSRKAIANLFVIFANCMYFYIYVVSGVTDISTQVVVEGSAVQFHMNLDNIILVNLGIYALNIIVTIYDLIISMVSPIEVEDEYTEELHEKEVTMEKYGRFLDR